MEKLQMKTTICRCITGMLLVVWMVVIFLFSAQPAVQSSQISGGISYRIIVFMTEKLDLEFTRQQQLEYAERLDYPIRKAAHMAEYGILAIFSFLFFFSMGKRDRRAYILALLFCVGYAITDEMHQLFVPGRAGRFSDVCIDTMGIMMALFLCGLICPKKVTPHFS